MPRQRYIGDNDHNDMACHVFALSGDPATAGDVNRRYSRLGDLLFGLEPVPADNDVAEGLNVVTNNEILASPGPDGAPAAIAAHSLPLLCREFGLTPQSGSGIRVWGHFEDGQLLPEHMYVTTGGWICDTMPDQPVYRRRNNNGLNPPAYGDVGGNEVLLANDVVFSIEVQALAPHTQAVVAAPDAQWQDVVEAAQDEEDEEFEDGDYIGGEDEDALGGP